MRNTAPPHQTHVLDVLISIPRTAKEKSGGGEEAQILLQVEVFRDHQGLSVEFSQNHSPLTPGFLPQRQKTSDFMTDQSKGRDGYLEGVFQAKP